MNLLCNIEAERSALGYLIYEPARAWPIFEMLKVSRDWFTDGRKAIWCLIEDLIALGQPVTLPSLSQSLGLKADEACTCVDNAGSPATIARDLQYLAECHGYRWLQQTLTAQLGDLKPALPFEDTLQALRSTLNGFSLRPIEIKGPAQMKVEMKQKMEHARQSGEWGIPSRFSVVNDIIAGYEDKKLVLIAGRPGDGKSTWGLNEAKHKAEFVGPVDIYSYEMEAEELWQKMAADEAGMDLMVFKKGLASPDEEDLFWKAWDKVHGLPIKIYSTTMKGEALAAAIRNNHARNGTKFIMVDYIQRISARKKFDGRQAEVGYISNLLCDAAKETCTIMALAQLNRLATREKPSMSHLRESGCLEADAYLVGLIYMDPDWTGSSKDDVPTKLDICKNRGGETGVVDLCFRKGQQRFAPRTKK